MKKGLGSLMIATALLGVSAHADFNEGPPKEHDSQANNRFKGRKKYRRSAGWNPGQKAEAKEQRRKDRKRAKQARKKNR